MADQDRSENWRPVVGWDKYVVSDLGRVIRVAGPHSRKRVNEPLKPSTNDLGYCYVNLCRNGKGRTFSVHGLVCEAFHGGRPAGMQVDHIDGNPSNNRADNLRWLTPRANLRAAIERNNGCPGNRGSLHGQARLNNMQARLIRWMRDFGVEKGWRKMLADEWGVSGCIVSNVCTGRKWSSAA